MSDVFLDPDGIIVPPEALTLIRARALARLVGTGNLVYVRLLECRRATGADGRVSETVVIETDVERPQVMVHEMRRSERIAAVFNEDDGRYPEALALRKSFPRAPHQNMRLTELPRSLCLYDRPWSEVAIRWTAATFIERIRFWLAQTARGRLHQEDQPLEQLLFDSGNRIILPTVLYSDLGAEMPLKLDVLLACDRADCRTFIAMQPKEGEPELPALKFVATTFIAKPQTHGIIRSTPNTLLELHDFLADGGINLVGGLRHRLVDWEQSIIRRKAGLVIIVALPLTRAADSDPERWDYWAFMTFKSVRDVGIAVGLWGEVGGVLAREIPFNDANRGKTIPIHVLSPYQEFSRSGAAAANGTEQDARKVVTVGAGALGSQVVDNLARCGFGTWTVVDEDDLLPHNLARHILHRYFVGEAKATGMEFHINALYRDGGGAKAIVADVLAPGDKAEALKTAFAESELILDIAASVPVARHLAIGVESKARRVSVFLNPRGTDVVVLAEAKDRTVSLDAIEAQYYRATARDDRLKGHLGAEPGRLRYGRSCRDITTEMPTHLVSMNAAIASDGVRRALASNDASIRIWRCDTGTMGVVPVEVEPNGALRRSIWEWTLVLDRWLLGRLAKLRAAKLPNETGGVLIGIYDLSRQIIYVVDTILSPPDSKEWPTLYIRGSEGLLVRVNELTRASGGQLEYVGEWHSHPDGCSTRPSADDEIVFTWLTERLDDGGLPALMAIVGQGDSSSWYLGQISPDRAWTVE
jgi:integrative and conjugative element protein (TIGR02256 family)